MPGATPLTPSRGSTCGLRPAEQGPSLAAVQGPSGVRVQAGARRHCCHLELRVRVGQCRIALRTSSGSQAVPGEAAVWPTPRSRQEAHGDEVGVTQRAPLLQTATQRRRRRAPEDPYSTSGSAWIPTRPRLLLPAPRPGCRSGAGPSGLTQTRRSIKDSDPGPCRPCRQRQGRLSDADDSR